MLASPSMQTIAASLMSTSKTPHPTVRSASRVLCLKLQELPAVGFKRSAQSVSMKAVVEAFLKYSPRVQARSVALPERGGLAPAHTTRIAPHWLFIDIASTSHLFHGEDGLMRSAVSLARDLGFGVQCAASDTPSGAQAFAIAHQMYICPPGEEKERLKELSLPLLLHLEGLEPWTKPSMLENLTAFFMMLGFKTVGDLSRFTSDSLQERWGETGGLLWKRLNANDRPAISALIPTEPLEDYVHLDFPVSLVSLLLHQAEKSVDFLFARLQGRRFFAQKLTLILHCEYSKTQHRIEIEPKTPSRNRELFITLLENRLGDLDLENPIRDFEMHLVPCPEKSQQLDFFEPRTTDFDKLQTLMSLLGQSSVQPGLYKIEPSIMPEKSWQMVASPQALYQTERQSATATAAAAAKKLAKSSRSKGIPESLMAVASEPRYGEDIMHAPRPTRLLKKPLPLSLYELQRLKILSQNPIERLESSWWETGELAVAADDGQTDEKHDEKDNEQWQKRDYYFAVSPEGQCLWIYQNMLTEDYFLHGYFD